MIESIWNKEKKEFQFEKLVGEKRADVVVVGAGIAGILIAYELQKEGKEVVIVEARDVLSGQTKNTTAKITSQHGMIYDYLIHTFSKSLARQYALANEEAIQQFEDLILEEQIDCDFKRCPAYLYVRDDEGKGDYEEGESKEELVTLLKKEADAAKELGIKASFVTESELPFPVKGAVKFENQARFHPIKFLNHLVQKLTIYENSIVTEIMDDRVGTEEGVVIAKDIVLACHYPFVIKKGLYFMRMHQERSYALALKNAMEVEGMYYGVEKDGLSFRTQEDMLVLVGAGHRTGKKENYSYEILRTEAKKLFKDAKEVAHWSAQDCMTLDKVPYIGRFTEHEQHIYVATGFKKWGMTTAMVASKIIKNHIMNDFNPYEEVFSPHRFHLSASMPTIVEDGMMAVKGITKGVFKTHKCSHLGCELNYNEEEDIYECPCHGSRFHLEGEVIDGPAIKPMIVKGEE